MNVGEVSEGQGIGNAAAECGTNKERSGAQMNSSSGGIGQETNRTGSSAGAAVAEIAVGMTDGSRKEEDGMKTEDGSGQKVSNNNVAQSEPMEFLTPVNTTIQAPQGRRLFHYTTGIGLQGILLSRVILPADAGVPDGEKPAVWFTYRNDFETTALKMSIVDGRLNLLSALETAEAFRGLVRIQVKETAAPHNWNSYRVLSGCHPQTFRRLESIAVNEGASPMTEWRCSFCPVPTCDVLAIDVWHHGRWQTLAANGQMNEVLRSSFVRYNSAAAVAERRQAHVNVRSSGSPRRRAA